MQICSNVWKCVETAWTLLSNMPSLLFKTLADDQPSSGISNLAFNIPFLTSFAEAHSASLHSSSAQLKTLDSKITELELRGGASEAAELAETADTAETTETPRGKVGQKLAQIPKNTIKYRSLGDCGRPALKL